MDTLGTRAKDRELKMLLMFYRENQPLWLHSLQHPFILTDLCEYGYVKSINDEQYILTADGVNCVRQYLQQCAEHLRQGTIKNDETI